MKRVLALMVVLPLLSVIAGAEAKGLKVYVSVDMEGVSGVVSSEQTNSESREYPAARKWMAEDVNAVIAGLLAAGATEIVVNDSHGGMRNISPDDMRPEAALISGTPKPLSMMAGGGGGVQRRCRRLQPGQIAAGGQPRHRRRQGGTEQDGGKARSAAGGPQAASGGGQGSARQGRSAQALPLRPAVPVLADVPEQRPGGARRDAARGCATGRTHAHLLNPDLPG